MSEPPECRPFAHRFDERDGHVCYRATVSDTSGPELLRWGIAATGKIAASMCEALRALPSADVVAVGSRSQDAADAFAARFGIPHAHGTYDDLFGDPDVDVVYVASPHSHHPAMTNAALDAGKHVLCER